MVNKKIIYSQNLCKLFFVNLFISQLLEICIKIKKHWKNGIWKDWDLIHV